MVFGISQIDTLSRAMSRRLLLSDNLPVMRSDWATSGGPSPLGAARAPEDAMIAFVRPQGDAVPPWKVRRFPSQGALIPDDALGEDLGRKVNILV